MESASGGISRASFLGPDLPFLEGRCRLFIVRVCRKYKYASGVVVVRGLMIRLNRGREGGFSMEFRIQWLAMS